MAQKKSKTVAYS